MKNYLILLSVGVFASIVSSCSGSSDKYLNDFAVNLGEKISKNQIDSVKEVYPSLDADSLALTFVADSITIVDGDKAGVYIVKFNSEAQMTLEKGEDENITVVSSCGLSAFPQKDMEFAKATGMLADSLDDAGMKARMSEVAAVKEFAKKKYSEANKKSLSIKTVDSRPAAFGSQLGSGKFVVTNTGNVPVKGSDYSINASGHGNMGMGVYKSYSIGRKGKDVPVGGGVSISFDYIGTHGNGSIIWKNQTADIDMDKDYTPTGKEWEEYQASKK